MTETRQQNSDHFERYLRQRYLTPDEKAYYIDEFERYKALPGIWRRDHEDDHGGRGRVDHEVLPLVDALNALDGVCTIQSCCGHRWQVPGEPEGTECVHHGQLWIRLDERMARNFEFHVGILLAHPVIWHAQKLYAFQGESTPHEVIDVQWLDGHMVEAEAVIREFFYAIHANDANDLAHKLAEMELHDDLPDSFDMGYMQAWREIKEWADAR